MYLSTKKWWVSSHCYCYFTRGYIYTPKEKMAPKTHRIEGVSPKNLTSVRNVVILQPALGGFGTIGIHMCLASNVASSWERDGHVSREKKLRRLNIPRPSIYKWMVSNWMLPNHYIKNGCFNKHPLINGCLGFQAGVKTPEIDNPQHQCI